MLTSYFLISITMPVACLSVRSDEIDEEVDPVLQARLDEAHENAMLMQGADKAQKMNSVTVHFFTNIFFGKFFLCIMHLCCIVKTNVL